MCKDRAFDASNSERILRRSLDDGLQRRYISSSVAMLPHASQYRREVRGAVRTKVIMSPMSDSIFPLFFRFCLLGSTSHFPTPLTVNQLFQPPPVEKHSFWSSAKSQRVVYLRPFRPGIITSPRLSAVAVVECCVCTSGADSAASKR
jgi:hypothetical protein